MNKEIKAVIFDLDGTLVSTKPEYRYEIVGKTLKELGCKYSKDFIDKFWFRGGRDNLINGHLKVDPLLFWKTYSKYDITELREKFTEPFSDIDFLDELKKLGFKIGIVTGAPIHITNLELGLIGREKFDAIVIANSLHGITPKPHTHGIFECLKIMGIDPDNCIGVGNSDEDIFAFQAAGVYDVFINRKEHEFPELPASLTIESLYELKEILE